MTVDATFALSTLERQLVEYVNNPTENSKAFNLESIPVISKTQDDEERRRKWFNLIL
jgi:coatomer protein complex subunit gamma